MSIDPQSWTKAERAVFEFLLSNIPGSAEGRNAFIGELPRMYDAWSLTTGGGPAQGPWNQAMRSMPMHATIVGVFTTRETAQAFAMTVIDIFGKFDTSIPLKFRGGTTQPTCKRDWMTIAHAHDPVAVWVTEIPCEMIFAPHAAG